MYTSSQTSKAIKELIDAGVIPKDCRRFELICTTSSPILLRYEVNATPEQVQRIADALIRNPEEARAIATFIAFPSRGLEEADRSITVELSK